MVALLRQRMRVGHADAELEGLAPEPHQRIEVRGFVVDQERATRPIAPGSWPRYRAGTIMAGGKATTIVATYETFSSENDRRRLGG